MIRWQWPSSIGWQRTWINGWGFIFCVRFQCLDETKPSGAVKWRYCGRIVKQQRWAPWFKFQESRCGCVLDSVSLSWMFSCAVMLSRTFRSLFLAVNFRSNHSGMHAQKTWKSLHLVHLQSTCKSPTSFETQCISCSVESFSLKHGVNFSVDGNRTNREYCSWRPPTAVMKLNRAASLTVTINVPASLRVRSQTFEGCICTHNL